MKYTIYYKVENHKTLYKFPGKYIEADSEDEVYERRSHIEDIVEIMWEGLKMTEMVVKKKRLQKDDEDDYHKYIICR